MLVPSIRNTGLINLVFNIIKNINYNIFDIMLVTIEHNNNNTYNNIDKYCSLGIYSIYNNFNKLIELTKKYNIDIIHSHGFYPDKILCNLIVKDIFKITTIHCMFFKDYPKEYGLLKGYMGSILHFYYLYGKSFDKIIGCSSSIKNYLRNKLIINQNIISINNGVDQNKFTMLSSKERNIYKTKLDLNNYDKIFIYSGRLIRRKQVPELILFFDKLIKKNKNICLLILGDGEERAECEKIANNNAHIKFLGHQDNPELYYQISDFIVSMSSAEGYPMSILEAVSCGCYAFLSKIPPHAEFIEENSESSDYIDNLSVEILDRRIKISNFYQLSAERMADEYSTVYLELINKK